MKKVRLLLTSPTRPMAVTLRSGTSRLVSTMAIPAETVARNTFPQLFVHGSQLGARTLGGRTGASTWVWLLAMKIAVHTWLVMLTVSLPAMFAHPVHTGVFLWLRFGGLGLLTLQGALLTMCSRPSTVTVMHTAVRFTMVASTAERAGQNVSLLVATGLTMIGHLYWITGKKHGLELSRRGIRCHFCLNLYSFDTAEWVSLLAALCLRWP